MAGAALLFRDDTMNKNEPTRQQKCADLARAMEWDFIPSSSEIAEPNAGEWYTPLGKIYGDAPPDYFSDHGACHAMSIWVLTQGREFQLNVGRELEARVLNVAPYALAMLAADPAIIAEAVWCEVSQCQQKEA